MDKLLDTARYDLDPKKRADALKKVQEIVAKEPARGPHRAMPWSVFGHKKTLGGVENYIKHPWCHDQINAYRPLELYKQ